MMRALIFGALLGILWLVFGLPLAAPSPLIAPLLQPVVLAFAAGLYARPHLARRGWFR